MGVSAESSNRQLPSTRVAHAIKRRAAATRRHAPAEAGRAPPPHGVRRACRAGRSALRLANRLAEEWYRQLIAQAFLTRGSIVVFDRHFLADYHAFDVAGAGRPLSRRIHGWMLMHAYPRPDLVVLLDAHHLEIRALHDLLEDRQTVVLQMLVTDRVVRIHR